MRTREHMLLFDYCPDGSGAALDAESLILSEPARAIAVFASHGHSDHFSPVIFDWQKRCGNIRYVLSHDIVGWKERSDVLMVRPDCRYAFHGMTVETLESTDVGVAFLVRCDGITLFHAGDLNWWHWEGEPDDENREMGARYRRQIDRLAGEKIDLAFIPVDPRLEEAYLLGFDYFMRAAGARMVFPMHFGSDYSVIARMRSDRRARDYLGAVAQIGPSRRAFTYRLAEEQGQ
ncbi:MAG: MBL fold metallo-hydrolase [Christensenellales bacterium]